MSHFYGGVHGGKGEATRTGYKTSGMQAYAKSWETVITVGYSWDEKEKVNRVVVWVKNLHDGRSSRILNYREDDLQKDIREGKLRVM